MLTWKIAAEQLKQYERSSSSKLVLFLITDLKLSSLSHEHPDRFKTLRFVAFLVRIRKTLELLESKSLLMSRYLLTAKKSFIIEFILLQVISMFSLKMVYWYKNASFISFCSETYQSLIFSLEKINLYKTSCLGIFLNEGPTTSSLSCSSQIILF